MVAHKAHNLKATGSIPVLAIFGIVEQLAGSGVCKTPPLWRVGSNPIYTTF